jgi:hypothetical protein
VIVGDPTSKSSYKLPHHTGNGFHVVPAAVRFALENVERIDMPAGDRPLARQHLIKHQLKIASLRGGEFDAAIFEQRLDELGRVYRAAAGDGDEETAKFIHEKIRRHVDTTVIVEPEPAPAPKPPSAVEQFTSLLMGKDAVCKNCGHAKSMHTGGKAAPGKGSCTAKGCDCPAMS